jgi:uncharacterized membrane protein YphA (DoxX/SURF4 family)
VKTTVTTGSRLLLGLIFFVFGLNGFLQFLPAPALPESAMGFIGGLASSGYFFPVLKGTEVVAGLLLLTGVAAPLALVVLAPITLQIFLFHSILTPGLQNSVLPLVMIALHIASATAFWSLYRPLFKVRSTADEQEAARERLESIGRIA